LCLALLVHQQHQNLNAERINENETALYSYDVYVGTGEE